MAAGEAQGEREAKLQDGQPNNRSSILGGGKTVFRSQKRLERLRGPPNLLFKRYRQIFLHG